MLDQRIQEPFDGASDCVEHAGLGGGARGLVYSRKGELVSWFPTNDQLALVETPYREPHGSARDFLRALKWIGAGTSPSSRRPVSFGTLRQAMDRFDASGAIASYRGTQALWTRDG